MFSFISSFISSLNTSTDPNCLEFCKQKKIESTKIIKQLNDSHCLMTCYLTDNKITSSFNSDSTSSLLKPSPLLTNIKLNNSTAQLVSIPFDSKKYTSLKDIYMSTPSAATPEDSNYTTAMATNKKSATQYKPTTATTQTVTQYIPTTATTPSATQYIPTTATTTSATQYKPTTMTTTSATQYTPTPATTPSAQYIPTTATTPSAQYIPTTVTTTSATQYTPTPATTTSAQYIPTTATTQTATQYTPAVTQYIPQPIFTPPPLITLPKITELELKSLKREEELVKANEEKKKRKSLSYLLHNNLKLFKDLHKLDIKINNDDFKLDSLYKEANELKKEELNKTSNEMNKAMSQIELKEDICEEDERSNKNSSYSSQDEDSSNRRHHYNRNSHSINKKMNRSMTELNKGEREFRKSLLKKVNIKKQLENSNLLIKEPKIEEYNKINSKNILFETDGFNGRVLNNDNEYGKTMDSHNKNVSLSFNNNISDSISSNNLLSDSVADFNTAELKLKEAEDKVIKASIHQNSIGKVHSLFSDKPLNTKQAHKNLYNAHKDMIMAEQNLINEYAYQNQENHESMLNEQAEYENQLLQEASHHHHNFKSTEYENQLLQEASHHHHNFESTEYENQLRNESYQNGINEQTFNEEKQIREQQERDNIEKYEVINNQTTQPTNPYIPEPMIPPTEPEIEEVITPSLQEELVQTAEDRIIPVEVTIPPPLPAPPSLNNSVIYSRKTYSHNYNTSEGNLYSTGFTDVII